MRFRRLISTELAVPVGRLQLGTLYLQMRANGVKQRPALLGGIELRRVDESFVGVPQCLTLLDDGQLKAEYHGVPAVCFRGHPRAEQVFYTPRGYNPNLPDHYGKPDGKTKEWPFVLVEPESLPIIGPDLALLCEKCDIATLRQELHDREAWPTL